MITAPSSLTIDIAPRAIEPGPISTTTARGPAASAPGSLVQTVLEAARCALDQSHSAPWRFIAIAGDARLDLASATARAQIRRERPSVEEIDRVYEAARARVLSAPLIVAVGVEPGSEPNALEDVCSGAAAIQSMLTAAHELGLAAVWRSGGACAAVEVKQLLGMAASELVLGFIYMGDPSSGQADDGRPTSDLTSWLGVSAPRVVKHAAAH